MRLRRILYSTLLAAALSAGFGAAWAAPAPDSVAAEATTLQCGARAVAGGIEIYNNTDGAIAAEVYSITGAAVWQQAVEAGVTLRLDLKAGIYIVRTADSTTRLLVR